MKKEQLVFLLGREVLRDGRWHFLNTGKLATFSRGVKYSSDRKNKCLYWNEGVKENKAKKAA